MQQKSNEGEIDTNTTEWCHFYQSNLSVVAAVFRHRRCTATLAIIRRREATSIQCRSLSQARWITVTSTSPAPHFIFLPPRHCFHPNPTSCRAHHPPLPFRQGSSSWRFNIHPFLSLQMPHSSTISTLSACCDACFCISAFGKMSTEYWGGTRKGNSNIFLSWWKWCYLEKRRLLQWVWNSKIQLLGCEVKWLGGEDMKFENVTSDLVVQLERCNEHLKMRRWSH